MNILKNLKLGPGELVQSLKSLPFRCKDPSSILSSHTKMPNVAGSICSPSVGEVEAGGFRELDHQLT